MFERFTDRGRRVLVLAQEEARLLNHNFIGTEHILLGLSHEGEGIAAKALESLGVTLDALRAKIDETIGPAGTSTTGSPPFTPRAKKVLELSLREALQLGHNYIGTEHLLLGLVREGEGVATQVLVSMGADLSRVRQQVIALLSGDPAGASDVEKWITGSQGGWRPSRSSGPRCPSCRAVLEGQVAYRVLTVPPEPGPGVGPLPVAFVYCRRCGVTIAHAPTGPDDPVLSSPTGGPLPVTHAQIHPSPPDPTRQFPDEAWNAPPPTSVPPSDVVDVRHSGRFLADGSLRGIVAGSTIDLTLELPRSRSVATGTLDGRPVSVTLNLAYHARTDSGLPATLQGVVGDQQIDLLGLFRHTPDYHFDRAAVEGTLTDARLTASIAPASGGYSSTKTIVATGTLDDWPFEIFVALGGSLERGHVRGTYDGRTVYLDLTATDANEASVTGSCPSPPLFALLLIASLHYFG